jgi:hypothetical protein
MEQLLRTGLRVTGLELAPEGEISAGRRQELARSFGNGDLVLVDVDVDADGFVVVPAPAGLVAPSTATEAAAAAAAATRKSSTYSGFGEEEGDEDAAPTPLAETTVPRGFFGPHTFNTVSPA